jgi:tetratricopeptide (TPR) repeat protein
MKGAPKRMRKRDDLYGAFFWRIVSGCLAVALLAVVPSHRCCAQFFSQTQIELNDAIRVNEPPPMVRAQLERVRVNISQQQWDEAIEGLRQLMENEGDRLVRLDTRFVPLRELSHRELATFPLEARTLYRGRVDHQAEQWYAEGVKHRDAALLRRVVEELFTSSFGDDALMALGEIALEQGQYDRAREYWERISPRLRSPDGLPRWIAQRAPPSSAEEPTTEPPWLAYPDTNLDLAQVSGRLVLVSVLQGADQRARAELQQFASDYPDAKGRLAGREGLYRETLAGLLAAATSWPETRRQAVATTFAGNPTRNFIAQGEFGLRSLAWDEPVSLAPMQASARSRDSFGLPARVAEDLMGLLSYHPLVVGNLVVVHDLERIYVYDLQTGQPEWTEASQSTLPGQIYPRGRMDRLAGSTGYVNALGVPRFTATVDGTRLFVCLGPQITSWPDINPPERQGRLVVLDLAQQGKLLAEIQPESDRWSFEGPPVCDGSRIYIAMRFNDVRPQAHVACYELTATTGPAGVAYVPQLQWRTMVCAAESPGRGSIDEITHNLLTLAEGRLYLNTNLGAVASLSADDGRILWLSTYPRAKAGEDHAHLFRDLTPCVYDQGTLFVAPADSPQLFAMDAMTGLVRWASRPSFDDVVHLLGVAKGNLIASGRNLWWLDAATGKLVTSFPEPSSSGQVQPFGRGVLVGDIVVWPTRELLYVFQQEQAPSKDANTLPAMRRDPIRLADYGTALGGGNIVVAGDYVLVAAADKLWAFGPKPDKQQASGSPAAGSENER